MRLSKAFNSLLPLTVVNEVVDYRRPQLHVNATFKFMEVIRNYMEKRSRKFYHLGHIFDEQIMDARVFDRMFYLSLISDEHFEQPEFYYNIDKAKSEIIKILKRFGLEHIRKSKDIGSIVDCQFFTGNITNLILAQKLSKIHGKGVDPSKHIDNHEIDCFFGSKKLCLEVKRLFVTNNVYDYIKEEMEKYSEINNPYVKNTLIVFILLAQSSDEIKPLMRSVGGYRNLFGVLQTEEVVPKNIHFYIQAFSPESILDEFIEDLNFRIESI